MCVRFFLDLANDHFATVEGVDIASDAIRYAIQHLNVVATEADFLDYMPRNPIDVVCLWDTIEHLERPHAYVEKFARILPPGGVIALTTGDIGSVVARLRGMKWRQIHPPTHLHYFSRLTLTKLLELRISGSLYALLWSIQNAGHNGLRDARDKTQPAASL